MIFRTTAVLALAATHVPFGVARQAPLQVENSNIVHASSDEDGKSLVQTNLRHQHPIKIMTNSNKDHDAGAVASSSYQQEDYGNDADAGILSLLEEGILLSRYHHQDNRMLENDSCDVGFNPRTNSCVGFMACVDAGNDGGSFCTGENSCKGEYACQYGGSIGYAYISNNSCNSFKACRNAGSLGYAKIGSNSCNSAFACQDLGGDGSVLISDNSCNGVSACSLGSSSFSGQRTLGPRSCNGYSACDFGEVSATVGTGSCKGAFACTKRFASADDISIGDNSCNCNTCCWDITGGSVIGDNQCNKRDDDCCQVTEGEPLLADSCYCNRECVASSQEFLEGGRGSSGEARFCVESCKRVANVPSCVGRCVNALKKGESVEDVCSTMFCGDGGDE